MKDLKLENNNLNLKLKGLEEDLLNQKEAIIKHSKREKENQKDVREKEASYRAEVLKLKSGEKRV